MPGKLNEEHIRKTAKLLALPAEFVRKDFYVTKAIKALVGVEDDYFSLAFQGGTSLSKGYQIISRLSEDADFRVILKPAAFSLGKEIKRKRLRDFRYALIEALSNANFSIDKEAVKVFYKGRFMSIRALFDDWRAWHFFMKRGLAPFRAIPLKLTTRQFSVQYELEINKEEDNTMARSAAKESHGVERFEARISADKKSVLKNAAELSGRTLTDFIVNSAYEAAIHVIQEHQQLHLSVKDRDIFIHALLNPPRPSDHLVKAAKRYKKDVISK